MVTFLRLLASGVLHRAASALNAAARAADPAPGRTPPRPPAAPHSDAQPPRGPSLRPVVQLSDGYLSDAETWQPSEYRSAPPEVVALMRIDRVIGNEYALSPTGLGRVRGLTLGALNDWHGRNSAPAGPVEVSYDKADADGITRPIVDPNPRKADAEQFWREADAGTLGPPQQLRHRTGQIPRQHRPAPADRTPEETP